MRTLIFEANGQQLKKSPSCDFSGIAKGSKGYLEAKFELSKDWDDCLIAASFFRWGKEYALPWEAPTGAHDMYKAGEYMIWTGGVIKKALRDTNFSPDEYPADWEDA